ncbi:unnamed protein product [Nesidiocoris tenuis]|uniref:Microtubule-associated protein n=1 Tax=Nesidiocoris tenuis TaxID=355587 RepID=A0A6H5FWF9_9HEMI|nr:unnamed protein product [Nesidiocoris tenuis]
MKLITSSDKSIRSRTARKTPESPISKKIEQHYTSLPDMNIQTSPDIIQLSGIMTSPSIKTLDRSRRQRKKLFSSFSSFDSSSPDRIKLPMNKIQVGAAPSPNLKVVRSKIGSLENAKHKPGGGNVKIESRKLDFKTGSRIEAKNDAYAPGGGEKKIQQVKLQWNAKSKIGSLENATHKPGGGDKKIETVKLDFKDKAKPKIGSKDNIKHIPGGGNVKIEDQKLEIKAQSKIGSLDNVKHKPGGGEVKIFDDREYMKQMMGSTSDVHSASNQWNSSQYLRYSTHGGDINANFSECPLWCIKP